MSIEVVDCFNVHRRTRELGCRQPTQLALLPLNLEGATTRRELLHAAETGTIRKLWRASAIAETPLEQPEEKYCTRYTKSADLILPAIFVSASLLSANPTAVSIAINVISTYVCDVFKGLRPNKACELSVVLKRRPGESYTNVKYTGAPEGVTELIEFLKEVRKHG